MIGLVECLGVGLALWVARAIYRVYFHPLSGYPGPKLAAVSSSWFEWFWNYYHNGHMIFEIERLHQKNGEKDLLSYIPRKIRLGLLPGA